MTTTPESQPPQPHLQLVNLVDAPKATFQEQRIVTGPIAPHLKNIPVTQTLVAPAEQLRIAIAPQIEPLVDYDPRLGSEEGNQPFYTDRKRGAAKARITFLAPKPGAQGLATDETLDVTAIAHDMENQRLGVIACVDVYDGPSNPDIVFESNMQNPDLFADLPTSHEQLRDLLGQYESLRRRTVPLDNRGTEPLDNVHQLTPLYLTTPQDVDMVAFTTDMNNADFRISSLDDPEVIEAGLGTRKIFGTLEAVPGSAILRLSKLALGDMVGEVPKSNCAIVTTMKPGEKPGDEATQREAEPKRLDYSRKVMAHAMASSPRHNQRALSPAAPPELPPAPAPNAEAVHNTSVDRNAPAPAEPDDDTAEIDASEQSMEAFFRQNGYTPGDVAGEEDVKGLLHQLGGVGDKLSGLKNRLRSGKSQ